MTLGNALNRKGVIQTFYGLIIVFHFFIIGLYSTNIPFADDYDSILDFINRSENATLTEKINLIFSQHNEHRIVLNRIISVIQYSFTGKVNFIVLTVIGNVFLACLAVMAMKYFKNTGMPNVYLLAAPLLIFNLSSFEAFLWPMVAMQTMGVILFAFLTIYLLFGDSFENFNIRFYAAFLTGVIATFSCGNGMLVLVVALVGLCTQRKSISTIITWLVGSVGVVSLYMLNYTPVLGHPKPLHTFLQKIELLVPHFFALLGDYFFFSFPVIVIAGFGLISLFLYFFIPRRLFDKDPVTFYFLSFLILSCVITSLSRAGFGAAQALAHRYHIYSALIVLFSFFGSLRLLNPEKRLTSRVFGGVMIVFVLIYAMSIVKYTKRSKDFASELIEGAIEYNENGSHHRLGYPNTLPAAQILKVSDSLGTYRLPPYSYLDIVCQEKIIQPPAETNDIFYVVRFKQHEKLILLDSSFAFIPGKPYGASKTFVVLISQQRSYAFETKPLNLALVTEDYSADAAASGFKFFIKKDQIENAEYRIGILIDDGEIQHFEMSNFRIQKNGSMVHYDEIGSATIQDGEFLKLNERHSVDFLTYEEGRIQTKGWAVIFGVPSKDVSISMMLKTESDSLNFQLPPQNRADVAHAFKGLYLESGYFLDQPVALPSGAYSVSLILSRAKATRKILTTAQLVVK